MILANIAAGICMLIFGRKLFWLFVGITGFIYGLNIAMLLMPGQPTWVFLAAAVCTGIFGTLVAIFLQHALVGLAGFLAGGYVVFSAVNILGVDTGQFIWLLCFIGGIFCGVLCVMLFDWALILLSSLIGALLIAQNIDAGFQIMASVFAACTIAGVAIQRALMNKDGEQPKEPS
jgi:hypothetical protein